MLQYVFFGLVTGSILAIATVGFSMIRQTEGFLNIAHGQFMALGAAVAYLLYEVVGASIWVAGVAAIVLTGLVGLIAGIFLFQPVRQSGDLVQLFTGIGLAYILYAILVMAFGSEVRTFRLGFGPRFEVADANFTGVELFIVLLSVLSVLLLHLLLTRTVTGIRIRAVATNIPLAQIRGVPTGRVSNIVWFLSASFAGLAGVMFSIMGAVSTELGWQNIILVLAAAVLGGLGSIYGVVAAGFLLGLAMEASALVIPTAYRSVVAFGVLIIVLLVRPEGLFKLSGRKQAA